MKELYQKLTSRKLWVTVAGIAAGICMALGGDTTEVESVAGAVMAAVSAVAYVLSEGAVDAAAAGNRYGDSR